MNDAHYICSVDDSIILRLNHQWMPINTSTPRAIIKTCMNGHIKIISKSGVCTWDEWIDSNRVEYYHNQPFLRSANNIFPVPTIVLTSTKYGYKSKILPKLTYLYRKYNGICQNCGKHFSIKHMTVEHIIPKSLGGPHEEYNTTLTCKPCNNKKANIFPYTTPDGRELKSKPDQIFERIPLFREEWKDYLFKG